MLGKSYRALFILVIVLPFLAQGVPFPGGIPLFLPFAIVFIPATVLLRVSDKGYSGLLLGDPVFMAICGATFLTYAYGLVLTIEFPSETLLREVANGIVAMAVVFAVANSGWAKSDCDEFVDSLAWSILAVGVFVGALGAWKLWVFVSAGELLDFVVVASSKDYPWGTSLHSDYNFYALTLLGAILSAMFLSRGRGPMTQFLLALMIAGLLVVGFLAGSRRFWVVAPLIMMLQAVWMASRYGVRQYSVLLGTLFMLVIIVPMAMVYSGDAGISRSVSSSWDLVQTGWNLQYRLMTMLDSSAVLGMGGRLELWQFATDRLAGATSWTGSGFDYMSRFSCEFGNCEGGGYPHMPILSAYLYGGWVAAVVALAIYVYTTLAGIRLFAFDGSVAWLFFPTFAALLFAAISANGPFSIRSHILLGALCVAFLRVAKTDQQASPRFRTVDG